MFLEINISFFKRTKFAYSNPCVSERRKNFIVPIQAVNLGCIEEMDEFFFF